MKSSATRINGILLAVIVTVLSVTPAVAQKSFDDAKVMVFTAEQARAMELPSFLPGPFWTPSEEVVRKAEQGLTYYVNLYAPRDYTMLKGDLSAYKRQYIGYTLYGHQVVYINAFCEDIAHWRQHFVWVYGGGECFFQLNYDPTAGMYFMFMINGS